MKPIDESTLETTTLKWFAELGYETLPPENLAPRSLQEERTLPSDVILRGRLVEAIRHLNPHLSETDIQEAVRRVYRREGLPLPYENEAFHTLLTDGLTLEVPGKEGGVRGVLVRLVDWDDPEQNDWMVSHQIEIVDTATGSGHRRIPDVVVFVNGLPLAVVELKNPADAGATFLHAYQQLQTYLYDIPSLFVSNVVLVASDDVHAKLGSITSDPKRFTGWRTVSGEGDEPAGAQPLQVLIRGVFEKRRFLDLVHNFVTFERERGKVVKKIAGYHQFHAVRKAAEAARQAASPSGDRRIGVVWHTQGSGKSLTMLFFARKLILDAALENPTLVVVTDRNDLDGQLFSTFAMSKRLLRQDPVQAQTRAHLRELLRTTAGGVVFTTIQRFLSEEEGIAEALSTRRNIIVIADEAHRSQYGFRTHVDQKSGKLKIGLAKQLRSALPGASFIGFTGTPIEQADKNTVEVFGDCISVYDIQRAVEDGATVPIYYENRLVNLDLDEAERPRIDPTFEELTETEEVEAKEALKSEWSTIEALVGTEKRLGLVARDLVSHFEKRLAAMDGKGLVVCMSRRICVELHDHLVALRPEWFDADDEAGAIKVVMTGSASDAPELRPHVRSKGQRDRIAERFKDPADPLRLVIVRDMWLTGFDAPCLHTLYVDKPMRGHNLAQAIARVNRVFLDKPAGLVVDYIGIATLLREAIATYTQSGGRGKPTSPADEAARQMLARLEICRDVFHAFDYSAFFHGSPGARLALLPAAREHVLAQRAPGADGAPSGHDRFLDAVAGLTTASAMAATHPSYDEVRDEVAFFQAVKAGIVKLRAARATPTADLVHAVRQIVANAIVTDEIIDVYSAAGLQKPDISVLSEEFLAEVAGMPHKNLAVETLRRLLGDEVAARKGTSVVQYRQFSERLEAAVRRYRARSIESVEVIEELLHLAHDIRGAGDKAQALRLSTEEAAFFEALAENASAKEVLGDEKLATIARELTRELRAKATIDWNRKENVRAKLRLALKKILTKYGYPPDGQPRATDLVLQQAETLGINIEEGAPDLLPDADPPARVAPLGPLPELPHALAVWQRVFSAQEDGVLRVKTRRDAFEKALTFLTGVCIALLRESGGGALPEAARKVVEGVVDKPLSMGTWHDIACRLAALVPAGTGDPTREAVRCLVTAEGKPSELALAIKEGVVKERNLFAHHVTLTKEDVLAGEAELAALWRRFEEALTGLRHARVIALAKIVRTQVAAGTATYEVRDLHSVDDHFSVREQVLRGDLPEVWCHLVRPGDVPLSLAPVVACDHRADGSGRDMFLSRSLVLKKTKKLELVSVTRPATIFREYSPGE